jgi:hypothetical protein
MVGLLLMLYNFSGVASLGAANLNSSIAPIPRKLRVVFSSMRVVVLN